MKINYKISALLFVLFTTFSCTKDFDEINDNPNYPTVDEANPALILPKILFEVGNEMTSSIAWGHGNIIAQLASSNNFTGTDRYLYGTYSGTWNMFYRNLRDANNMLAIGEAQNNALYQATALTLRAWMLANLTEMYGDVPYSEALKGKEDEFKPGYDKQIDIYRAILADLEQAATLAAQGGDIDGDILYGGNADNWRRLANSLRLRYILRLEKKWGEMGINGASLMQTILDSEEYIQENAQNGAVPYLAATNRWPKNAGRVGSFDEKRMSQTIETFLKDRNDPRMPILFRPIDNPDSDEFVGVPNGLSEDAASNFNGGANNQSRLGMRFREEPATVEMMIMSHAEVMFILAEAAEKKYISADADTFYNHGINSNMAYLGASGSSYVDQPLVSYGSDNLEKIANQKWIALFLVGNEAWFDYRRTGLPALVPGPNAALNVLPSRIQYPNSEQVLNEANYNAVVQSQGADEIDTKMWLLK